MRAPDVLIGIIKRILLYKMTVILILAAPNESHASDGLPNKVLYLNHLGRLHASNVYEFTLT